MNTINGKDLLLYIIVLLNNFVDIRLSFFHSHTALVYKFKSEKKSVVCKGYISA